jgi:uncharacterized protein (DUF1499 family)
MRTANTRIRRIAIFLICLLPILACSGKRPSTLGASNGSLAPCPSSPNCVSSDAADEDHRVEPFALAHPPHEAWGDLSLVVTGLPRTTIVEHTDDYLHAECTSALFGFVDDLELQLRASDGAVAVRSASRVGRSDMGVNRRRVERLRELLRKRNIVR